MILENVPIGSIVYDSFTLMNDSPIQWTVLSHSVYGEKHTLLWCKQSVASMIYSEDTIYANWESSMIRDFLNNEFKGSLSSEFQQSILPVSVGTYYGTVQDEIFILSSKELGKTGSYNEGTFISYFDDVSKLSLEFRWWTRSLSVRVATGNFVDDVAQDGSIDYMSRYGSSPYYREVLPVVNVDSNISVGKDETREKYVLFAPICKYFIKSDNKIYTLYNGVWQDTKLTEPLTQENFKDNGFDSLSTLYTPRTEACFPTTNQTVGTGNMYRVKINSSQFKGVNNIIVK